MATEAPICPPAAPAPNGGPMPALTDDALAEVRKMFTAEQYEKTKSFVTMFCSAQGGSSLRAVAVAQSLTRSMSVPSEALAPAPAPTKPTKPPVAPIKREPSRTSMTHEFENASSTATPVIPSPASDSSGFGKLRISLSDAAEHLSQRERDRRKEKRRRFDEAVPPLQFTQQPQYAPAYAMANFAIKVEPPTYAMDFFTQPLMPSNAQHAFKRTMSDSAAYQRPVPTMEQFMEEKERREAAARSSALLRPGIGLPVHEDDDEYPHSLEQDSPSPSPAMSYASLPNQHHQLQYPYQYASQQDMASLYAPASAYASHMAATVTPQKNIKSIPPTSSPYHADQVTPAPFPIPSGPRSTAKPAWSYAALIGQAITAAPSNRASLSQIYNWISTAYPFYKRSEAGWQNSIRHNLSLNECFVKIKREEGEKGKGCWWGIRPGDEECFAGGGFRKKGSAARAPSTSVTQRNSSESDQSRKRKAPPEYDDSEEESTAPPPRRPVDRAIKQEPPIVWAVPDAYDMPAPPTHVPRAQAPAQHHTPVRPVSSLPPLSQQFPNMPGLTPTVSSPPSSSPMGALHTGSILPPGYSVPSKLAALAPSFELSPKPIKGRDYKRERIPLQPKFEHLDGRTDEHGMSPFTLLTQSAFKEISPNSGSIPLPLLPKTSTITNMGPPATPKRPEIKRPRTPPSKVSEIISNPSKSDRRLPTIPGLQEALSTPPARKLMAYDELQLLTPSRIGGSHGRSVSASGIFPSPSRFAALNSTPSRGVFGSPGGSSLFGTPLGRALAQKWDMSDPATQANEDLQMFISSGTKLGLFESPVRGSGSRSGWDSPGFDNW
ncbi:hypothetical protein DACRYDRAFT_114955 [Dacryopinax primogenitus]|uniref:Fork-head domain-containing protein n=1 Tax=Dacryopinax primogenitus (strain DJM 731) TaxID=1858805 RepID=M5FZY8_DACPD|nr:uncharacterized protein DACRYDRAFT_114955 [Dacryopinax primogenitus]EJU03581.1 hypothetical protein DACRYDRAFT_114955 [Dacryopinax primogenitus]